MEIIKYRFCLSLLRYEELLSTLRIKYIETLKRSSQTFNAFHYGLNVSTVNCKYLFCVTICVFLVTMLFTVHGTN